MEERVGQQFGNFQVLRLLHSGKLADVYLAEHATQKTRAAVKILHVQLAGQEVQDFLAEAQSIAHLKHPHIARLLKAGVKAGMPYLATLYLSHGTLRERHPRGSKLLLETAISYARQAAEGLHYAHEQGVVHQNLKPQNLFLTSRSEVLVADFGIAMLSRSALSFTSRATAGTAEYMAPEQVLGQVSPATDQYMLAVLLYEWLAGVPPFTGKFAELVAKHTSTPPPSLRAQLPNLAPEVEEVIFTALEKDPQRRFATVRAFVHALERASLRQAAVLQSTERARPPSADAGVAATERAQIPPAAPAVPPAFPPPPAPAGLPPTERVPAPAGQPAPPLSPAPPMAAAPLVATERAPAPPMAPMPPAFPPIPAAAPPMLPAAPAVPVLPVATERAAQAGAWGASVNAPPDPALLPPPPPPPAFVGAPVGLPPGGPPLSPPFASNVPSAQAGGGGITKLVLLVGAAIVLAGLMIGIALLVSHH